MKAQQKQIDETEINGEEQAANGGARHVVTPPDRVSAAPVAAECFIYPDDKETSHGTEGYPSPGLA